ncbi:hypothetical protein O3G_MSEX002902, partial [Manduca sexta]
MVSCSIIFQWESRFKMLKFYNRYISSFNIIMFIRIIFGNYHPIAKSKKISMLLKLYCVSVPLVVIWMSIESVDVSPIPVIHCIINIIFNLISEENYLIKYCNTIKINDVIMGFKKTVTLNKRLAYALTILFLSKSAVYIAYWYVSSNYRKCFIISFVEYSIDLNEITNLMIFGLMYDRMRLIRIYLEGVTTSVNIIRKDEIAANIRRVKIFLKCYNNLLDNLDSIETQLQCK